MNFPALKAKNGLHLKDTCWSVGCEHANVSLFFSSPRLPKNTSGLRVQRAELLLADADRDLHAAADQTPIW